MSEENVELVRRFYEASQRSLDAYWRNRRSGLAAPEAGDLDPALEAVLAFLHPEVEYNAAPAVLWGGNARGHLGYLRRIVARTYRSLCRVWTSTPSSI